MECAGSEEGELLLLCSWKDSYKRSVSAQYARRRCCFSKGTSWSTYFKWDIMKKKDRWCLVASSDEWSVPSSWLREICMGWYWINVLYLYFGYRCLHSKVYKVERITFMLASTSVPIILSSLLLWHEILRKLRNFGLCSRKGKVRRTNWSGQNQATQITSYIWSHHQIPQKAESKLLGMLLYCTFTKLNKNNSN